MENLKKLRKDNNLSQSEMAKIVNMSVRGYQNIEYGINEASYSVLFKLADYFGCSVDYLIGHQSKDIVSISGLTENQQNALELVKTLTDYEAGYIVGCITRLRDRSLGEAINNVLNGGK